MTTGRLLRYGINVPGTKEHPEFGTIQDNRWVTGTALIIGERKVKQPKLTKVLYETLGETSAFKSVAKPQEYDTYYTVLMPDGSKRELTPYHVQELL